MKNIIRPIAILGLAAALAASCLSNDDNNDITYYSDTAITSFSLGTMNRYLTTKATTEKNEDGTAKDSVYKVTYTGSQYKFYIDQANRLIYNADSLPTHTDTTRVICSVGSKSGGVVVIKYRSDEGKDSLVYYNSSDSVNFARTDSFLVYANDGVGMNYSAYRIKLNVHKEEADSFVWRQKAAAAELRGMEGMRAVPFRGSMMVFGLRNGATESWATQQGDGSAWTRVQTNVALGPDAYYNMVAKGDELFTLSNGTLMRSADGMTWEEVTQAAGSPAPARLIGAGKINIYALTAGGIALSASGEAWQADGITADVDRLPQRDVSCGTAALKTNGNAERIIMAGNLSVSGAEDTDTAAVVWNKVEEYEPAGSHKWYLCSGEYAYQLPRLNGLAMTAYGDALVALGGSGIGGSKKTAFSELYVSRDNGLTWHTDSSYPLPATLDMSGSEAFAITADSDGFLWIISSGTGQVWKGRLNKMGWKEEQTEFTK